MDEQIDVTRSQKENISLKNISFVLLMALSFLLPIFIIPSQTFSFLASKDIILMGITLLLFFTWLIERIKNKDFTFSKNLIVISAVLVPFVYLLSALFSGSIKASIVGFGFGSNTFSMVVIMFLLMFLTARLFETKKIIYLFVNLFLSFAIIFLFHILRLIFGPSFLSMGLFTGTTSNFVGTWSEFGIFSGLIAILSLLTIIFMDGKKVIKVVGYLGLVASVFFVALVNILAIWVMLALVSLAIIAYRLLANKTEDKKINKKVLSITSVVVFVLSLIFIFARGPVGGFLPNFFNIQNYEVRPSIGGTMDIVQATLTNDPILGVGPNNFVKQWIVSKPLEINNTQFWNTEFNSGANSVMTALIEVGLLGFLAWLLFFASIVYLGIKLLKVNRHNKFNQYIYLSVFSAVIYLWSFSFLYIPGTVILSLSFIFTGALLALCYQDKVVKLKPISSSKSIGKSIILIAVASGFLLAFVFDGYIFVKKMVASSQAQQSILILNTEGDIMKSMELMRKAGDNFKDDLYYRLLTEMDLLQLNTVLSQTEVDEETIQTQFQGVFQNAVLDSQ